MAPSWVLLDRQVPFPHDQIVIEEGEDLVGLGCPPSDEEMIEAIALYLQSLKPDPQLVDPPNLSSLRMLPPMNSIPPLCSGVTSARISSSDKNLVALYAGAYRPGVVSEGCYLIYDTRKNFLSTIPQLPLDHAHDPIGRDSALVVSDCEGGGYVLAEVVRMRSSDVAEAALCLWQSSAKEWVVKACHLPHEIYQPPDFYADNGFLSDGSTLCWVDLLKGLVVCDLSPVLKYDSDPEFRFIPLPGACAAYDVYTPEGQHLRAEEFRYMSYVQGAIKFLSMDGYVEHQPGDEILLTVWTLSSDLKWDVTCEYNVGNIWKNETHQAIGMPKIAPSLPVLSMYEHDVVYLVFTDVRVRTGDRKLEYKGQYLLRVDMANEKVQFYPGSTKLIHSQFMAIDFSAYQQGLVDNPRELDASELGASGKRRKF